MTSSVNLTVNDGRSSVIAPVMPPRPAMSDGEILTRAREAYIAAHRPWRWMARRIRKGWHDKRLAATISALHDIDRPMALIVSERDQAIATLVLRTTPGMAELDNDTKVAVAAALLTAIRIGRRG